MLFLSGNLDIICSSLFGDLRAQAMFHSLHLSGLSRSLDQVEFRLQGAQCDADKESNNHLEPAVQAQNSESTVLAGSRKVSDNINQQATTQNRNRLHVPGKQNIVNI